MAQLVMTNAFVTVNGVDLSDHVKSVTLDLGFTMLNDTVMGDTFESNVAGIQTWSASIDFVQDWASSKVDQTLFPLLGAAAFTIVMQPVNTTEAATNPKYTGSAVLSSYNPLGSGSHGDLVITSAKFACAGALTKDITP